MLETVRMIIEKGAKSAMTLEEIIKAEINEWRYSTARKQMIEGQKYYSGEPEILKHERTIIGQDGRLEKASNLANNKLANNFYRKLVDQKIGYLLSKPFTIKTENSEYLKSLNIIFTKSMHRKIQNLGKEAINKGTAWLHVYYDDKGNLCFKKIPTEEIIPIWKDAEHTELDAIIRVYEVEAYEGKTKKTITKVEWWDTTGVKRYVLDGNLIPDVEAGEKESHFVFMENDTEKPLNWEKVPFVCFKYNNEELPLIKFVKSLIDDYDKQKSNNSNNLEDLPNSIYVVKNYGGTNGGEFRKNISQFRVVFVSDDGGVESVNIQIDTEAYKNHQEQNRKDIYEFARGVDTQQKDVGNSPSGVSLKFLYADLDMDCNTIETEFQASLEQVLWFVNAHLANTMGADYSEEAVEFIFNRDIIINESQTITDIKNSVGIVSDETLVANHPYVTDTKKELEKLKKQREEDMQQVKDYPGLEQASNTGGENT